MSQHKPEPQNDPRQEIFFERYTQELKKRGEPRERFDIIPSFLAGWRARQEAALDSAIGTDPDSGSDIPIMRDYFGMMENRARRFFDMYLDSRGEMSYLKRLVESQRDMIIERGQDPLDAPLWRKLSNQRKELKAAHRTINQLIIENKALKDNA